jgi:hypothetical protein
VQQNGHWPDVEQHALSADPSGTNDRSDHYHRLSDFIARRLLRQFRKLTRSEIDAPCQSQTRANKVLRTDFASGKSALSLCHQLQSGAPMRNKRVRAFWITLLFYALAGPLVGLLFIMVIGFLVAAWGPIIDRLTLLMPDVQDPSCVSRSTGYFDLRCFQRFEPRQFRFFLFDRQTLSLYASGSYVIGFIPALLAGALIARAGFRIGDSVTRS